MDYLQTGEKVVKTLLNVQNIALHLKNFKSINY